MNEATIFTNVIKTGEPCNELASALLDLNDPRMLIRPLGDDWLCPYTCSRVITPEWDGSAEELLQCRPVIEHLSRLSIVQEPNPRRFAKPWRELLHELLHLRFKHAASFKRSSQSGAWICPFCETASPVILRHWDGSDVRRDWFLPQAHKHLNECQAYLDHPLKFASANVRDMLRDASLRPRLIARARTDQRFQVSDDAGMWICPFELNAVPGMELYRGTPDPLMFERIAEHLMSANCPARYSNWEPDISVSELHRMAGRISALRDHEKSIIGARNELRRLRDRVGVLSATETVMHREKTERTSARLTQLKMLPDQPPAIPGYDIAAYYAANADLGGDLYDFLHPRPGQTGFVIGDVSGHGVGAAIVMTAALSSFTALGSRVQSARELLCAANQTLAPDLRQGKFVSAFYAILEHSSGAVQYARAGHMPGLLIEVDGSRKSLRPGGIAIGVGGLELFAAKLEQAEIVLNRGSALLLYTDGITEAMNAAHEEFGEARVFDLLERTRTLPASAIVEHIIYAVRAHLGIKPQNDDWTMIVLKRN